MIWCASGIRIRLSYGFVELTLSCHLAHEGQPRNLSYCNYVGSLLTFCALDSIECYGLTFSQCLKASSVDSGEMDEHITATILLDESKSFLFIEPLNFTVHVSVLPS